MIDSASVWEMIKSSQHQYMAWLLNNFSCLLACLLSHFLFLVMKKKKGKLKYYLAAQGFHISKVICSFSVISNMAFSYLALPLTQQSCFITCSHKFYLGGQNVSRFLVGSHSFS